MSQFKDPRNILPRDDPREITAIKQISPELNIFVEQLPPQIKALVPNKNLALYETQKVRTIQKDVDAITGRMPATHEESNQSEEKTSIISALQTQRVEVVKDPRDSADYRTRNMRAIEKSKAITLDAWWDLPLFLILCIIVLALGFFITGKPGFTFMQIYTTIVWTPYSLIALVGIAGLFAAPFLVHKKPLLQQKPVPNLVIYQLPSITKDSVLPSLIGVIDSVLANAPRYTPNFLIQVIYNEGAEAAKELLRSFSPEDKKRILFVVQPKSFKDGYGTKKKCLANQYALLIRRYLGLVSKDIIIVHLDDDTKVTDQLSRACAYYIQHQSNKYIGAQGPLAYAEQLGGKGFWAKFCWLTDAVRGGDDMLRFRAVLLLFHRPLFGLHGENMVMRSDAEDAIGWSFGPTHTEDALFAMIAIKAYGGAFCYLQGGTIGAPPESPRDFIIQRGRWCQGLVPLIFDKRLVWYSRILMGLGVANWVIGFFQNIAVIAIIAAIVQQPNTSPVEGWIIPLWAISYAYQIFMYLKGYFMNLDASKAKSWKYWLAPGIILLMPFFSILEALGALWGIICLVQGKTEFAVINKGGGQSKKK